MIRAAAVGILLTAMPVLSADFGSPTSSRSLRLNAPDTSFVMADDNDATGSPGAQIVEQARSDGTFTLDEAYRLAVVRNERIASAREETVQAEALRATARAAVLPHLSLEDTYYRQNQVNLTTGGSNGVALTSERNQAGLELIQPLFSGFRDRNYLAFTKENIAASQLGIDSAARQLYGDIASAYYAVLGAEAQVRTLEDSVHLETVRLEEIQSRRDVGLARKTDVLLAQSQLSNDVSELTRARNDVVVSRQRLGFLTGTTMDLPLHDEVMLPEASVIASEAQQAQASAAAGTSPAVVAGPAGGAPPPPPPPGAAGTTPPSIPPRPSSAPGSAASAPPSAAAQNPSGQTASGTTSPGSLAPPSGTAAPQVVAPSAQAPGATPVPPATATGAGAIPGAANAFPPAGPSGTTPSGAPAAPEAGGAPSAPPAAAAPAASEADLASIRGEALGRRVDLQELDRTIEAQKHLVDVARGEYLPTLSLDANYYFNRWNYSAFQQDTDWTVEVMASIPIFDGGRAHADVATARSQLQQAILNRSAAARSIEVEVQAIWSTLQSDLARLRTFEDQVRTAQENFDLIQEEYRNGIATNLEVLAAQNQLLSGRIDLERQRYQSKLDWVGLELVRGRLPAESISGAGTSGANGPTR